MYRRTVQISEHRRVVGLNERTVGVATAIPGRQPVQLGLVYHRGLLLLTNLVCEKNIILAENLGVSPPCRAQPCRVTYGREGEYI